MLRRSMTLIICAVISIAAIAAVVMVVNNGNEQEKDINAQVPSAIASFDEESMTDAQAKSGEENALEYENKDAEPQEAANINNEQQGDQPDQDTPSNTSSIFAADSSNNEPDSTSALNQTPIGQSQSDEKRICPHCGLKNAATATFCTYCGVQIPR